MIRPLRLADVAALLLFLGKSPVNEARARGRLGNGGWELSAALPALKGCLVASDARVSYVCIERGVIQGLACLRSCCGPHAWEVERLLLSPGHEERGLDLLERLGSADEEIGRVFLRLLSDSGIIDAARQAGFSEYLTEILYRLDPGRRVAGASPEAMRPKTRTDDYGLFRLYSALVPLQVRTVEGMTFEEWRRNKDRGSAGEYVLGEGGEPTAWIRIRRDGRVGQFDMLADSGSSDVEMIVDQAQSKLSRSRSVYCLVSEFQTHQYILEERGFRRVAEFRCLSKDLLARVREPHLMPLSA